MPVAPAENACDLLDIARQGDRERAAAVQAPLIHQECRSVGRFGENAIGADQTARLTEKLNQTLAAKVKVNAKVDPSLLGGLVVKIGSKLIDSSIRTKLIGLERIMKGA